MRDSQTSQDIQSRSNAVFRNSLRLKAGPIDGSVRTQTCFVNDFNTLNLLYYTDMQI